MRFYSITLHYLVACKTEQFFVQLKRCLLCLSPMQLFDYYLDYKGYFLCELTNAGK